MKKEKKKEWVFDINPDKLIPVEVEWADAHSSMEDATITELENMGILITKSVGYLMANNKEKVVLASMLYGTNALDETIMKHYQVIPKGMVRKIIYLKRSSQTNDSGKGGGK